MFLKIVYTVILFSLYLLLLLYIELYRIFLALRTLNLLHGIYNIGIIHAMYSLNIFITLLIIQYAYFSFYIIV